MADSTFEISSCDIGMLPEGLDRPENFIFRRNEQAIILNGGCHKRILLGRRGSAAEHASSKIEAMGNEQAGNTASDKGPQAAHPERIE